MASIIGLIAFIIVPGLIWSYIFFPKTKNDPSKATTRGISLSLTLRLIVSVCLSLALVSISIFYLDYLFGLRPSFFTTAISIVGTSSLGIILLYFVSPHFIKQCVVEALDAMRNCFSKIRSVFKGY